MGLLIHMTMELERSGELSESFKATLNIRCKHDTTFLAWENCWIVYATYWYIKLFRRSRFRKKWIIPSAWNILPLRCLRDIHVENIPEVVRYMRWKLRTEDGEWRNFRLRTVIKLWKRIWFYLRKVRSGRSSGCWLVVQLLLYIGISIFMNMQTKLRWYKEKYTDYSHHFSLMWHMLNVKN